MHIRRLMMISVKHGILPFKKKAEDISDVYCILQDKMTNSQFI